MRLSPFYHALVVAVTFTIAGCSSSGTDSVTTGASAIAKVAGDTQRVVAGTAVTINPSVRVTNASGVAVSGVAVTFAVASGGGSLASTTATTGNDGTAASGQWTLGSAGGVNTVTASAANVSGTVTFTATGLSIAGISKFAGDGQSAAPYAAVATPPAVKVVDGSGNPVAGVSVTFFIQSGGGYVNSGGNIAYVTTNASGVAALTSWYLGASVGANTMSAFTAGTGVAGNPLTFTATAQ